MSSHQRLEDRLIAARWTAALMLVVCVGLWIVQTAARTLRRGRA